MNILVTGGAGFIGSHFVKRLLRNPDNKVVIIDKLTYAGNKRNLPDDFKMAYFYELDININNSIIKSILDSHKIDMIVNFAAESHVDNSIKYPKAFLETDIMGLFNLVYQSLKYGKIKKFIHISTDEVYGPIDEEIEFRQFSGEGGEAKENWLLNPTSPYSASKACADLLLQSYFKTYDLPVVIIRPCNNYGPNQYPEKLIPATIMRLLQGKKAILHGEGQEIREWIYVDDCCRAIEKIMYNGEIGEIYNVGSGDRKNNYEIICRIIHNLIYPYYEFTTTHADYHSHIEFTSNRPGNDQRYAIDSSKTHKLFDQNKEELNTYLRTSFDIGLQQTIDWYKDNQDHWNDVDFDSNIYSGVTREYLR